MILLGIPELLPRLVSDLSGPYKALAPFLVGPAGIESPISLHPRDADAPPVHRVL